jgi:hypothetical protein
MYGSTRRSHPMPPSSSPRNTRPAGPEPLRRRCSRFDRTIRRMVGGGRRLSKTTPGGRVRRESHLPIIDPPCTSTTAPS